MDNVLFFDTGPIISLVLSRLSWLLPELKKQFGGKFYITPAVKLELVERPLQIRRYSLEALQVAELIRKGVLEVYPSIPTAKVEQFQKLANTSYEVNQKMLDIIQLGEMQSVTCAKELNASVVMDERTLRLFIENSAELELLLERRFGDDVIAQKKNIAQFQKQFQGMTIIRSIELVSIAYKLGLLNSYLLDMKNAHEILINSILWATKYNGCAVTEHEIDEIKKFLLKK